MIYRTCLHSLGSCLLLLALASFAHGQEWSASMFDCATLEKCTIDEEQRKCFKVLPEGGPSGGPALVFADPVKAKAALEVDLSALKVNFTDYDELHFDFFQEGGVTMVTTTLWGYPDEHRRRNWYSIKRFQKVGAWDHVRYDLHIDDDGAFRKPSEEPHRKLTLAFAKSKENPADAMPEVRARIANVRLVKSLVNAQIDPRKVRYEKTAAGISYHHPLRLTNRTDKAATAVVEVVPETLREFRVKGLADTVTLKPGESRAIDVCLFLPAGHNCPPGYAERGLVKVRVKELPGYDAIPLRAYRPVYLFGMVPLEEPEAGWLKLEIEKPRARALAVLQNSLDWKLQAPPDVAPWGIIRPDCPKCGQALFATALGACRDRKCERYNKALTPDPEDPKLAAKLTRYHEINASLTKAYALAYRSTEDERFGRKAVEMLVTYAEAMEKLPMVQPASMGVRCRLACANIFLDDHLIWFTEAYMLMKDTPPMTQAQAATIHDKLLIELLDGVNRHCYGLKAGQLEFILDHVKCAPALGAWYYLADMLVGDSGWDQMLARAFSADGVALEGGAYAGRCTLRMVNAAEALHKLGIEVDKERVTQIVRNSLAAGVYGTKRGHPRPSWFESREEQSTVLANIGFTVLINGKDDTWRKTTINWGSSRDRSEYDLLSYDLRDRKEQLIKETGRISYNNEYCWVLMPKTSSHNVPVVDEQNISRTRKVQEYFHSDDTAACCLIADTEAAPAYPNARVSRAVVLTHGLLLVVDRVKANKPCTIDLSLYGGDSHYHGCGVMKTSLTDPEPFEEKLGQKSNAYKVPWDLRRTETVDGFQARWSWPRGKPTAGLRLRFLAQGCSVFEGKTRGGWMAVERNFLMVRKQDSLFTPACLYERIDADEKGQAMSFARLETTDPKGTPVSDGRALAYRITLEGGKQIDVLVSFDGGAYTVSDCEVDAEKRIAVALRK